MSKMITLAIVLDRRMAESLSSCAFRNFVCDQPDRFEIMAIDGHENATDDCLDSLTVRPFRDGTMMWCGPLSDALLLRAFEQSCGYDTAVLWDLAHARCPLPSGGMADAHVVLSTRPWPHG